MLGEMKCMGCEIADIRNHAHHIRYKDDWNNTKLYELKILCETLP